MVVERFKMIESDSEKDENISFKKTHKEIHQLLEEIKNFEKEYGLEEIEPEFIDLEPEPVEFIDIQQGDIDQIESVSESNLDKGELTNLKKKNLLSRIKLRTKADINKNIEEEKIPTFKIRFNKDNCLAVNINRN